jgi:ADP-ribose pyrophosphatase
LWKATFDAGRIWTFVSRKEKPEIITGISSADAVVIIASVLQSGIPKLVTIKEYRPAIGAYEYGFPAGLIDGGEKPEDAAVRELKEETGLDTVHIYQVTPPLYSSSGLTDESTIFVYLEATGTLSAHNQEETENIEPMLLEAKDIINLLEQKEKFAEGRISCKYWPIAQMFATTGLLCSREKI